MTKKKPTKDDRALPMPKKYGGLPFGVLCPHAPVCLSSMACIARTVEYAMGKRRTP